MHKETYYTMFGIKEHFPLSIITVRILHARFNYLRYTEHNNFDDTLSILYSNILKHVSEHKLETLADFLDQNNQTCEWL